LVKKLSVYLSVVLYLSACMSVCMSSMMATRPARCSSVKTRWCWRSSATMDQCSRHFHLISEFHVDLCSISRLTLCLSSTGNSFSGAVTFQIGNQSHIATHLM